MSSTVAEEAEDEVGAGLTLSHGPGEKRTECLAQVLMNDRSEALLSHICSCIDKVGGVPLRLKLPVFPARSVSVPIFHVPLLLFSVPPWGGHVLLDVCNTGC